MVARDLQKSRLRNVKYSVMYSIGGMRLCVLFRSNVELFEVFSGQSRYERLSYRHNGTRSHWLAINLKIEEPLYNPGVRTPLIAETNEERTHYISKTSRPKQSQLLYYGSNDFWATTTVNFNLKYLNSWVSKKLLFLEDIFS